MRSLLKRSGVAATGSRPPVGSSPRQSLELRQLGQTFATILDQKLQQPSTAYSVDPTTLNTALASLRHQSCRNELRDVVGERRFRNPQFTLNLADRQAALAGFDQEPKYLEAMRVAQLGQTTRGVLERDAARSLGSAHPQPTSRGCETRTREGVDLSSVSASNKYVGSWSRRSPMSASK
jgi:hypothetical protein